MLVVVEATLYVSFQLDLLSPSEGSASYRQGLIAGHFDSHPAWGLVYGGAKHKERNACVGTDPAASGVRYVRG